MGSSILSSVDPIPLVTCDCRHLVRGIPCREVLCIFLESQTDRSRPSSSDSTRIWAVQISARGYTAYMLDS